MVDVTLNTQDIENQNRKILVVEDNGTNRLVLTHKLGKHGFGVTCAENGLEAIRILEECDFDVILMDVSMPLMDGLQATRHIRSSETIKSSIPIIGFSAHNHDELRNECFDCGMDDFICKPASDEIMLEKLRRAFLIRSGENAKRH